MFNESDVQSKPQSKVLKPQSVCKKPTTNEPPARVVTEDEAKKAFQSPTIFDRRKSQVTLLTTTTVDSDGYTYPYVYHEDIIHFVEPSLRLNQGVYKGSVVNGGYYVAPTPTVVPSKDPMSYLKYIRNLIDQYMIHAS